MAVDRDEDNYFWYQEELIYKLLAASSWSWHKQDQSIPFSNIFDDEWRVFRK